MFHPWLNQVAYERVDIKIPGRWDDSDCIVIVGRESDVASAINMINKVYTEKVSILHFYNS